MVKRTVLYAAHQAHGADMTDFGGYEMPVRYKDSSIVDEHVAVREKVGMFDVTHMGRYWVHGKDAQQYLDLLVPRDVTKLEAGRGGYTYMLNESGGFRDDVIVSQLADEEFFVVCNAGNRDKIWHWMSAFALSWKRAGKDVTLENKSDISCMIAVQGPQALQTIGELAGEEITTKRFRLQWITINNEKVLFTSTGYTGEAGGELILISDMATIEQKSLELWKTLVDKGVVPCALGSRDTLRLEAGYCLYGNDIDETTPLRESGIDFYPFAALDKEQGFVGQVAVRAYQPKLVRVGFKLLAKGIPRHGYKVMVDGKEAGVVTSGTRSPISKEPIGMAYVPLSHQEVGSTFEIDMRGKLMPAEVIPFPTYDTTKYGATRS